MRWKAGGLRLIIVVGVTAPVLAVFAAHDWRVLANTEDRITFGLFAAAAALWVLDGFSAAQRWRR